ncbi:helix-turn-helix transcriptional regulator [Clostridium gasigenes]|uniref:helix-turn-helix domain-containing protein n=1 Tax=Clostridium gasigenes TaxID=94869 RepID=UPI00162A0365|nr:helix-turn-helix transcriptional regulator [Clostridium gasigenes]MBB6622543.1 helix-turn-helix transcriptional regulator [Clostridium gasigenes]
MFANKLKQLRTEQKLTQSELAKILKTSASSIGMYEQNRRVPDIELIKIISEYFNVSTDYLLGKSDIKDSADKIFNSSNKTTKQIAKDKEIDTIAAHLEGKDITPHKMKMIKRYIDDLFEDFDD